MAGQVNFYKLYSTIDFYSHVGGVSFPLWEMTPGMLALRL